MIREMDEARHALERGEILKALRQEYGSAMVPVRSLAASLNLVGYPMTTDSLQFSLVLLADNGYLRIWRANEMGNWRADRENTGRPDVVVFAKLLPKGLLLIDGRIAPDPSVSF